MSKHLFVNCRGREIHIRRWGDPSLPAIIAWHGLTRNGGDFAPMARALADSFCIYAPDTIGRGLSQWAREAEEYQLENYAAQAQAMMDALGIHECCWVGTSMGGLLGIMLAAKDARIRRLLINDVGPELPIAAVARIVQYASASPVFPTVSALEKYVRQLYAGFGALGDDEWRELVTLSYRRVPGGVTLNHDPRIGKGNAGLANLWDSFKLIQQPMLLLRGVESEILTEDIAARMLHERPNCALQTFTGCGHAPFLNTDKQINTVRNFCLGGAV